MPSCPAGVKVLEGSRDRRHECSDGDKGREGGTKTDSRQDDGGVSM